ncbi:DUF427 domain-containing protein [Actibacterium sp. 188UL27-1]|uniref:DUF427 domain-containing protein n=1 Tax=Actibacterium sp. 188UL27-1 TaxID=2786961 RepID=UPI001959A496|nr:DUF427 domain-containing protein [Actibacterium sp. 188UL27-1]MBM7069348.1 DUF427 domain-containing protein [Actibacterium sp. 188UL27-1]
MLSPENVQDYPRPPRLEPVPQTLRILLDGRVIAETRRAWRVLETHHAPTYYIPLADIADDALVPATGGSFCEWKGRAQYWDVRSGAQIRSGAAWSYPKPTRSFLQIADHVSFYASQMEACFVGEVQVTAQPGDFYGGWVTPNLTGTIKGWPGTEGW